MPRYVALFFSLLLLHSACHRKPYATYQPNPRDRYEQPDRRSPQRSAPTQETTPPGDRSAVDVIDRMAGGLERLVKPNSAEEERSTEPERRVPDRQMPDRRAPDRRAYPSERSAPARERSESAETRRQEPPKRLGNRIRESLGLPERKPLNWWQRIPWQLKAAPFVIGVAVAFAFLKITILAIIFGLLGAFLLIRGLKRSFKVRRPWL